MESNQDTNEKDLDAMNLPHVTHEEAKSTGEADVFEVIDPAEERRLVRKLDMVILPLMAFVYFFQCTWQHNPGIIIAFS